MTLFTILICLYLIGCIVGAAFLALIAKFLKQDIKNETTSEFRDVLQEDYDTLFSKEALPYTIGFYVGLSWYGVIQLWTEGDITSDAAE